MSTPVFQAGMWGVSPTKPLETPSLNVSTEAEVVSVEGFIDEASQMLAGGLDMVHRAITELNKRKDVVTLPTQAHMLDQNDVLATFEFRLFGPTGEIFHVLGQNTLNDLIAPDMLVDAVERFQSFSHTNLFRPVMNRLMKFLSTKAVKPVPGEGHSDINAFLHDSPGSGALSDSRGVPTF